MTEGGNGGQEGAVGAPQRQQGAHGSQTVREHRGLRPNPWPREGLGPHSKRSPLEGFTGDRSTQVQSARTYVDGSLRAQGGMPSALGQGPAWSWGHADTGAGLPHGEQVHTACPSARDRRSGQSRVNRNRKERCSARRWGSRSCGQDSHRPGLCVHKLLPPAHLPRP